MTLPSRIIQMLTQTLVAIQSLSRGNSTTTFYQPEPKQGGPDVSTSLYGSNPVHGINEIRGWGVIAIPRSMFKDTES